MSSFKLQISSLAIVEVELKTDDVEPHVIGKMQGIESEEIKIKLNTRD